MTVRPSTDRTTAGERSASRRRRSSSAPTAASLRHAIADLREQTVLAVALFEVALDASRRGDSDHAAELLVLGMDAARGARERARAIDDALTGCSATAGRA